MLRKLHPGWWGVGDDDDDGDDNGDDHDDDDDVDDDDDDDDDDGDGDYNENTIGWGGVGDDDDDDNDDDDEYDDDDVNDDDDHYNDDEDDNENTMPGWGGVGDLQAVSRQQDEGQKSGPALGRQGFTSKKLFLRNLSTFFFITFCCFREQKSLGMTKLFWIPQLARRLPWGSIRRLGGLRWKLYS